MKKSGTKWKNVQKVRREKGAVLTWTLTSGEPSNSTRRGTTLESMTSCIYWLPASVRYDSAQTVSTRICQWEEHTDNTMYLTVRGKRSQAARQIGKVKVASRLTLVSVWLMSRQRAGNRRSTVSIGGGGSLFRHKLTMTHVTLRRNVIGISSFISLSNGSTTPSCMTKSLHCGPSPVQTKYDSNRNDNRDKFSLFNQ